MSQILHPCFIPSMTVSNRMTVYCVGVIFQMKTLPYFQLIIYTKCHHFISPRYQKGITTFIKSRQKLAFFIFPPVIHSSRQNMRLVVHDVAYRNQLARCIFYLLSIRARKINAVFIIPENISLNMCLCMQSCVDCSSVF